MARDMLINPPMFALRSWLALCVSLAVLVCAGAASAQTIIVPQAFNRILDDRESDGVSRSWINYDDCVQDDAFSWNVTLSGFSGSVLEVWVGQGEDCTNSEVRSDGRCWKVFSKTSPTSSETVTIPVRDVVAKNGPGAGTQADCESTDFAGGIDVAVYFMLIAGDTVNTSTTLQTATGLVMRVDLQGPSAPGGVSAGIGENRLVVKWDPSEEDDVAGYRVYCDPPPGSTASAPASQPMAADGGSDASAAGAGGASGAGGLTSLDAGADGSAGAAGSAGTAGAGTGGTGTGNAACPSALVSGARPDNKYRCGSTDSPFSDSATASSLINGTTYAVAVAAVDTAGNSGPLSAVACGTPQEVDDFFELYRRAGGNGGGGYCGISRTRNFGLLGLLALAGLGLSFRRWRRR